MALSYYVRFVFLLSALMIVLYILSILSTPISFGKFGFYRGDNVREWIERPVQYAGANRCVDCHYQEYSRWNVSEHFGISCETCHGALNEHVKNGSSIPVPSDELCRLCHSPSLSRPRGFPQINPNEHWSNITIKGVYTLRDIGRRFNYTCLTCHDPMDVRLTAPLIPHPLEGRSDCRSCHGLEGTEPFPNDHALRPNDVCFACHKVSKIPQVPHTLEGMVKCLLCHRRSSIVPFPEDHIGRTADTCLQCHKVRGLE